MGNIENNARKQERKKDPITPNIKVTNKPSTTNTPVTNNTRINNVHIKENDQEVTTNVKPPLYQYVLAWFSFNFCYNLLSYFFIFLLIKPRVNFLSNEITFYSFLIPFIGALSMGIAFILVFNFFKNLNVKKIIPYIWVINGLLYLSSLGNEIGTVKNIHGGVVILYILGFLGGMLIIHSYYQKKHERWY